MIVNLTPHEVTLYAGDQVVATFPSEGLARCSTSRTNIGSVDGYPLNETTFGDITGLPHSEEGKFFLVSAIVAQAAKAIGRTDCIIVDDTVRDADGRICGCRAFVRV